MYRIIEHFALGRRRLELFGEDHNIRQGWLTVGKGLSSSNFNAEVKELPHGILNPWILLNVSSNATVSPFFCGRMLEAFIFLFFYFWWRQISLPRHREGGMLRFLSTYL